MSIEKKIIDYISNKESIDHWITLKGCYRYEKIISFMEENNLPLTWKNITNYTRYDKRILYNCFKYVVVLEEFFKSMISKYLNKSEKDLLTMEFSNAVNRFLEINPPITYDDMDIEALRENKTAFIDLRNSVAHNKILLGRTFRSRSEEKEGIEGKSLGETLEIYRRVLPQSYREGFVSDIRKCSDRLGIDFCFCFFKKDSNYGNSNPRISRMHQLEEIIGYRFLDINKLDKAMDSSILENDEYCNGAWGTIGDGLLHGLLGVRLLNESVATKGDITEIRTNLENNDTQFALIKGEGILDYGHNKKYFNDGTNIPDNEKPVSSSHNDYLEAIIAAIYYDGGYYCLKRWFDDYLYDLLKKYKVEKQNNEAE